MSDPDRILHPDAKAGAGRRWALLALLLGLTLAGGVAARMLGGPLAATAPTPSPGVGDGASASAADGLVDLTARLDRSSVLAGDDGLVKLELGWRSRGGDDATAAPRTATDLIVVLDRSGSMQGAPITHALGSIRRLVGELGDADRFALVTYASSARTLVPLTPATPDARRTWTQILAGVAVGGGTDMSAGLDRAAAEIARARTPGRATRLVLVSDGHANEGDASREGLLARAGRAVAGEYVVSTVGVGEGFDESLMTALADAGTGNFYFVQRADDLGRIFAGEFASARAQLASALEVAIRPAPGVEVVSAAGYPLEASGDVVRFRPGPLFAGQSRRVWITFRVPTGSVDAHRDLGAVALHYTRDGARRVLPLAEVPAVAVVADESHFLAGLSEEAWAASVAEDAMGALKAGLADALQRDDVDGALRSMSAFRQQAARRNAVVQSPAVDELLEEVAEMEAAVGRAVAPAARNRLSKQYSAEGYDVRRPGAKYDAP